MGEKEEGEKEGRERREGGEGREEGREGREGEKGERGGRERREGEKRGREGREGREEGREGGKGGGMGKLEEENGGQGKIGRWESTILPYHISKHLSLPLSLSQENSTETEADKYLCKRCHFGFHNSARSGSFVGKADLDFVVVLDFKTFTLVSTCTKYKELLSW